MTVTHAVDALREAFEIAVEELDGLIDRHFVARRTLVVSNDEVKFWTAAIGDDVLYRSPDGAATWRFAVTFASRNPGVTAWRPNGSSKETGGAFGEVSESSSEQSVLTPAAPVSSDDQHSVRVPEPDNVVPILGRVEA